MRAYHRKILQLCVQSAVRGPRLSLSINQARPPSAHGLSQAVYNNRDLKYEMYSFLVVLQ